jgi:hypothetical protein
MNPEFSKLQQKHQEQQVEQTNQLSRSQSAQEKQFETVEELLRFDAEQNPVPPGVGEKLNETLSGEPQPATSWWQRLFKSG